MAQAFDFVILGGGLAGLSTGSALGPHCVVLERDERPGGLVRTEAFGAYWFDRVIHLLHFKDPLTEAHIRALLGSVLSPCAPVARVVTGAGTCFYPIQANLRGLNSEAKYKCLNELQAASSQTVEQPTRNYEQLLLSLFGPTLCEIFFFPYNRKAWKRPLKSLTGDGFTWNIARPDFQQVTQGASEEAGTYQAYNANGWYPRPGPTALVRGMEVLAVALARQVVDLRLDHTIESIDLSARLITARARLGQSRFHYRHGCVSTLPLPRTIELCNEAPASLKKACRQMPFNRVLSVMLCIKGPRPAGCGHWQYFADESLIFSRLVFMHEFDPCSAPQDGWGLMAEVSQPGEAASPDSAEIISRTIADLGRVGLPQPGSEIIEAHVVIADPAYVVFTNESQDTAKAALDFLRNHGIESLGRYGRWEYSSMAQVLRDGFAWGREALSRYCDPPQGAALAN